MSDILPFVVTGLTAGAVYSIAGVGLVLTYRTSGVFNFAHGALATVAAYLFYTLHVTHHLPWVPAAIIAIVVLGPIMGLVLELLARALQRETLAVRTAATVGLMLVIAAAITLIYDTTTLRTVPVFVGSGTVKIAGTNVTWFNIITVAFGLAATVAVSLMLRLSRAGLAMRAVVDDEELLDASGLSPARVRRLAWIVGATLAAASGVLFAPLLPLDPIQLTLLVVSALGAAAIGRFQNLPLTFGGGLLIGVLASLATRYFTSDLLAGVPPTLPFIVLFLVLLVIPRGRLMHVSVNVLRQPSRWETPTPVRLGLGVAALAFLAFVPKFAGIHLTSWTVMLGMTVLFVSLSLLVRTSGQVSLCHITFAAIGAAGFSHLSVDHHVPWLVALVLAGLIAVPVGALLAIPAIRLPGLYLALATFGFGILVQYMFYSQSFMFRANGVGLTEPRPHLSWLTLDSDKGYYYVVLIITVLSVGLLVAVNRGRLGRLLRGMADSPTTLETSGTSVAVTRVIVFCLSAFLAAVAGALIGVAQSTVTGDSYQPFQSLVLLTLIVVVGVNAPWNALIAALVLEIVPSYFSGANVPNELQVVIGAAAIAIALLPARFRRLPQRVTGTVDRLFSRRSYATPAKPTGPASRLTLAPVPSPSSPSGVALALSSLRVQFGGVVAVNDLDLSANYGEITGLIGPNGAGKTTTFNVCSGLIRPNAGRLQLSGHDVTRFGTARRARSGLGRTFQRMELFDSLTVRQNVALGGEAALADANPLSHLFSRRAQRRVLGERVEQAIGLCGLSDLAQTPVSSLSTGQRRIVDLARCLAGDYRVLLLDEPSSGLDRGETAKFADILRRVVDERGVAVLLVEHDLSLVLEVCARIYVLNFGLLISSGTPVEITADPKVQAAYLGDAAVTPDRQDVLFTTAASQ